MALQFIEVEQAVFLLVIKYLGILSIYTKIFLLWTLSEKGF